MKPTDEIHWDLSDLFVDESDPRLRDECAAILKDATKFRDSFEGKLAHLTATELRGALDELESLTRREQKPVAYAYLGYVTNTGSQSSHGLLSQMRDLRGKVRGITAFFIPELLGISAGELSKLCSVPQLAPYARFLQRQIIRGAHVLSSAEEAILARTEHSRRRAWSDLYMQLRPKATAEQMAVYEPVLTRVCSALVLGKQAVDDLRGFSDPVDDFSLDAGISKSVMHTVELACLEANELPLEHVARKKAQLGVSQLRYADMRVPSDQEAHIEYEEAKGLVLDAFGSFSPKFADLANSFFQNRWIDPLPREGKTSGGSTEALTPDHHPYIYLNFDGRPGDASILAHELGHGIHFMLAGKNHMLDFLVSPVLAETASTFCELLLWHHQRQRESGTLERVWTSRRCEDAFQRVFGSLTSYLFDLRVNTMARTGINLTSDTLRETWQSAVTTVWGNSFDLEDEGENWIHQRSTFTNPFYSFTYVFGELAAQCLFSRWLEEGEGFARRYISFLEAGGSSTTEDLLTSLGLRPSDASTWEQGLSQLRELNTRSVELNSDAV